MSNKARGVLICVAILQILSFILTLCACDSTPDRSTLIISSDTYIVEAGETLDLDEFREKYMTDEAETTTVPPETTVLPDTTQSLDTVADDTEVVDTVPLNDPDSTGNSISVTDTVYWVKGGEVWHTKSSCSSLSRSKSILSGTVEQAMLAGKSRVCKRCGK